MPAPKTIDRRLWDRVTVTSECDDLCWVWEGTLLRGGYGCVGKINGKTYQAHRLSWELANGPIPSGMLVCHKCDNRRCVRPSHLFLGTYRDNIHDMERKGRGRHPAGDQHGRRTKPESAPLGEANGRAKLTADRVLEIRAMAATGHSYKALSRIFDVSETQISIVVRRKNWKHV